MPKNPMTAALMALAMLAPAAALAEPFWREAANPEEALSEWSQWCDEEQDSIVMVERCENALVSHFERLETISTENELSESESARLARAFGACLDDWPLNAMAYGTHEKSTTILDECRQREVDAFLKRRVDS